MFKDGLVSMIKDLIERFASVGQENMLSGALDSFNGYLYSGVEEMMQSVVMPIAYTILALFAILELYKASLKTEGAGGGTTFGAEVIFRVLFRMTICKLAIDNSLNIMQAIYSVSTTVVDGVSKSLGSAGAANSIMDLETMKTQIDGLDLGGQLLMMIQLSIINMAVTVMLGLIKAICVGRFIEIYLYIAIAPIPIATFPSHEMSQIGKGFLKSFAAVCLQGTLIYIILAFFPSLVESNIMGETGLWGVLFYALVLSMAIYSSGHMAKSMCNAM